MKILFKNANIVTESEIFFGYVVVDGGKIMEVGRGEQLCCEPNIVEEYDLTGKYLLPGVIDSHVHFRTPGHEYKEDWNTGSLAAIAGGVTTVLDMPNNNPPAISVENLNAKRKLINGKTNINYGLYIGATPSNIEELKQAKNIAGVKIYMGASTGNLLVDKHNILDKIFKSIPEKLIAVHAENDDLMKVNAEKFKNIHGDTSIHSKIRSCDCACMSTKEAVALGKAHDNRLHICHMSCGKEFEEIAQFKLDNSNNSNLQLSCEVAPHHLFLNIDDYEKLGNFGRMNPPLRQKDDNKILLDGLKNGIIDLVATDHAPHTIEEKQKDYWDAPSGVPGVQTMLPLLLNEVSNGTLNLNDIVKITSVNPVNIFRIKNKGYIKKGYDADLVVVDMNLEKKILNVDQKSKCGWSPFNDKLIKGWPVQTFVNGELVFDIHFDISEKLLGKEIQFE